MVLNWLAEKRNNPMHDAQEAIDLIDKMIESLEQKEKFHMEQAAMHFETAKHIYRANNKRDTGALDYMKMEVNVEKLAQQFRQERVLLHKEVRLIENIVKDLISAESVKKKKKKLVEASQLKPKNVFICLCFCLFLSLLTYHICVGFR